MNRAALALALAALACKRPPAPDDTLAKPLVTPSGCEDVKVAFESPAVVRLCGPRTEVILPGSVVALKLAAPVSLHARCAGPREHDCQMAFARDNLAPTDRFWAPRSFAKHGLIVFFADAPDADLAAVEIVQALHGSAQSIFAAVQDKAAPFAFESLEDLDGDGSPELVGMQAAPALEQCHPYAPMAVFKLRGGQFVRDEALMRKWAEEHKRAWHGPDIDAKVQVCEDD